jgi:hypothetical protein
LENELQLAGVMSTGEEEEQPLELPQVGNRFPQLPPAGPYQYFKILGISVNCGALAQQWAGDYEKMWKELDEEHMIRAWVGSEGGKLLSLTVVVLVHRAVHLHVKSMWAQHLLFAGSAPPPCANSQLQQWIHDGMECASKSTTLTLILTKCAQWILCRKNMIGRQKMILGRKKLTQPQISPLLQCRHQEKEKRRSYGTPSTEC